MLPSGKSHANKSSSFPLIIDQTVAQFLKYDFWNDAKFQAGWKKVEKLVLQENRAEKLQRAKIFYYSKHIENLASNNIEFLLSTGLQEHSLKGGGFSTEIRGTENCHLKNKDDLNVPSSSLSDSFIAPNQPQSNISSIDGSEHKQCEAGNESGCKETLSFQEVVDYIQRGETIPGLEQLNIQPLNVDPTPTSMEVVKKPWE